MRKPFKQITFLHDDVVTVNTVRGISKKTCFKC